MKTRKDATILCYVEMKILKVLSIQARELYKYKGIGGTKSWTFEKNNKIDKI